MDLTYIVNESTSVVRVDTPSLQGTANAIVYLSTAVSPRHLVTIKDMAGQLQSPHTIIVSTVHGTTLTYGSTFLDRLTLTKASDFLTLTSTSPTNWAVVNATPGATTGGNNLVVPGNFKTVNLIVTSSLVTSEILCSNVTLSSISTTTMTDYSSFRIQEDTGEGFPIQFNTLNGENAHLIVSSLNVPTMHRDHDIPQNIYKFIAVSTFTQDYPDADIVYMGPTYAYTGHVPYELVEGFPNVINSRLSYMPHIKYLSNSPARGGPYKSVVLGDAWLSPALTNGWTLSNTTGAISRVVLYDDSNHTVSLNLQPNGIYKWKFPCNQLTLSNTDTSQIVWIIQNTNGYVGSNITFLYDGINWPLLTHENAIYPWNAQPAEVISPSQVQIVYGVGNAYDGTRVQIQYQCRNNTCFQYVEDNTGIVTELSTLVLYDLDIGHFSNNRPYKVTLPIFDAFIASGFPIEGPGYAIPSSPFYQYTISTVQLTDNTSCRFYFFHSSNFPNSPLVRTIECDFILSNVGNYTGGSGDLVINPTFDAGPVTNPMWSERNYTIHNWFRLFANYTSGASPTPSFTVQAINYINPISSIGYQSINNLYSITEGNEFDIVSIPGGQLFYSLYGVYPGPVFRTWFDSSGFQGTTMMPVQLYSSFLTDTSIVCLESTTLTSITLDGTITKHTYWNTSSPTAGLKTLLMDTTCYYYIKNPMEDTAGNEYLPSSSNKFTVASENPNYSSILAQGPSNAPFPGTYLYYDMLASSLYFINSNVPFSSRIINGQSVLAFDTTRGLGDITWFKRYSYNYNPNTNPPLNRYVQDLDILYTNVDCNYLPPRSLVNITDTIPWYNFQYHSSMNQYHEVINTLLTAYTSVTFRQFGTFSSLTDTNNQPIFVYPSNQIFPSLIVSTVDSISTYGTICTIDTLRYTTLSLESINTFYVDGISTLDGTCTSFQIGGSLSNQTGLVSTSAMLQASAVYTSSLLILSTIYCENGIPFTTLTATVGTDAGTTHGIGPSAPPNWNGTLHADSIYVNNSIQIGTPNLYLPHAISHSSIAIIPDPNTVWAPGTGFNNYPYDYISPSDESMLGVYPKGVYGNMTFHTESTGPNILHLVPTFESIPSTILLNMTLVYNVLLANNNRCEIDIKINNSTILTMNFTNITGTRTLTLNDFYLRQSGSNLYPNTMYDNPYNILFNINTEGLHTLDGNLYVTPSSLSSVMTSSFADVSNTYINMNAAYITWSVSSLQDISIRNQYNDTSTRNLFYSGSIGFASDPRLKENIEYADLERCSHIIDTLSLHRFAYCDTYMSTFQQKDHTRLGFLTTEVAPLFPKSVLVTASPIPSLSSIQTLDTQQIKMAHIGATQALLARVSTLEGQISMVKARRQG